MFKHRLFKVQSKQAQMKYRWKTNPHRIRRPNIAPNHNIQILLVPGLTRPTK